MCGNTDRHKKTGEGIVVGEGVGGNADTHKKEEKASRGEGVGGGEYGHTRKAKRGCLGSEGED